MNIEKIVGEWFQKWEEGDFEHLPLTDNFKHTSPYGTITGKEVYEKMVNANKNSFLGHRFELHDGLYGENKACVRYTTHKGDWSMDVSEWFYMKNDKISQIISYYNVGEVSYNANLNPPEE